MRLSDCLLNPSEWPEPVRVSADYPELNEAVILSLEMAELLDGDKDLDLRIKQVLTKLRKIACWLPRPTGSDPRYTRKIWSMAAIAALVPNPLLLYINQRTSADEDGFKRWEASLSDHTNTKHVGHPSDLEHMSALLYGSYEYSEAWTPNIAVARIVIAAYLLAAIQTVLSRVIKNEVSSRRFALPVDATDALLN